MRPIGILSRCSPEIRARLFRKVSTESKSVPAQVQIDDKNRILELNLPVTTRPAVPANANEARHLKFHTTWLRHQCRCSSCFNASTFQSNVRITPNLLQASLKQAELTRSGLALLWEDGHQTEFGLDRLQQMCEYFTEPAKPNVLSQVQDLLRPAPLSAHEFSGDFMKNAVDFKDFMANENALVKMLKNIVTHGFGVVAKTPADLPSTEAAVERVSHLQRTIFAEKSCLLNATQGLEHKDTAYTSEALDFHSDNTYFDEPMGLEVFHCLSHDGEGGLSSFTDAFYAAQLFFRQYPASYKLLSTTPILFEYLDAGKHHYSSIDTIFGHNKFSGILERVKFNTADMVTPMHIPLSLVGQFYESMNEFVTIRDSTTKWMKLSPGTIIFFDNWRILHGRSEFTGNRLFATMYIGRSDWLSKARVLSVI